MRIDIDSLDDPRVAAYRNLKDRDLSREGDRFLAEGEVVTRRLLASKTHAAESVLCGAKRWEVMKDVADTLPVFVAPDSVVDGIVGFHFHSGVMSIGVRPASPTIASVVSRDRCTLLIAPKVASTDNLGALIRIAAGFGCDALVLGEESCDPYYRQSVRVSMGTVFSLPIVRSEDIRRDLRSLREDHRVDLWATVLDDDAESLATMKRPARVAVLLGNESAGLERDIVSLCPRKVTIPMKLGTDSLNVAISAAVFLYALTSGDHV